jgi:hypothetical protein
MRFNDGEGFCYATNSAAATCSFNMTASSRHILIKKIDVVCAGASNAVVTVQASGTTLWAMQVGSAAIPTNFDGLWIDSADAQSLSANVTASAAGAYIAVCGQYHYI